MKSLYQNKTLFFMLLASIAINVFFTNCGQPGGITLNDPVASSSSGLDVPFDPENPNNVNHSLVQLKPALAIRSNLRPGSSEFHREGKSYTITGQVVGYTVNLNPSSMGVTFGKYLTRNSLVQIEAMSGSKSNLLSGSWDDEVRTSSFGVHYKQFVGNTFYFRGGLDHRTVDFTNRYWFLSTDRRYNFKGESTGATFLIGNQWHFNGFTLGCDWFGITAPFASRVTDETFYNADRYDRRSMEEDQDQYLRNPVAHFTRFYIGASF